MLMQWPEPWEAGFTEDVPGTRVAWLFIQAGFWTQPAVLISKGSSDAHLELIPTARSSPPSPLQLGQEGGEAVSSAEGPDIGHT